MYRNLTVVLLFLPLVVACPGNSDSEESCVVRYVGPPKPERVLVPFDQPTSVDVSHFFEGGRSKRSKIRRYQITQQAPGVAASLSGSTLTLTARDPRPTSVRTEIMQVSAENDCGGDAATANIELVLGLPAALVQLRNAGVDVLNQIAPERFAPSAVVANPQPVANAAPSSSAFSYGP